MVLHVLVRTTVTAPPVAARDLPIWAGAAVRVEVFHREHRVTSVHLVVAICRAPRALLCMGDHIARLASFNASKEKVEPHRC